jgi:hypothetical protein
MFWDADNWKQLRDRTKFLIIFGGAGVVALGLAAVIGISAATDGDWDTKDQTGVGVALITAYDWTTHQLGADDEPTRLGCRLLAQSSKPGLDDGDAFFLAEDGEEQLRRVYDSELRRRFGSHEEFFIPSVPRQSSSADFEWLRLWCRKQVPDDRYVKRWYYRVP